jgi:hypothetical protein
VYEKLYTKSGGFFMKKLILLGIIALAAVIGFSMTACKESGGNETVTIAQLGGVWLWQAGDIDPDYDYNEVTDGVIEGLIYIFTVKSDSDDWAFIGSNGYKVKAGAKYDYKFEAWTQSGERTLHIQCYEDSDSKDVLITSERKTYILHGDPIPATAIDKNGEAGLRIPCGDQVGKFSIKFLSK